MLSKALRNSQQPAHQPHRSHHQHSYERVGTAAAADAGDHQHDDSSSDVVVAAAGHYATRSASHTERGALSVASAAALSSPPSLRSDENSIATAFFLMGLLNNASYVIMLASAKSISEGGTALVFLSCVIPSLTLKASAPYWFDKVDYKVRLAAASYLMAFAFVWVALFSKSATTSPPTDAADSSASASTTSATATISFRTIGQLVGVAMISIQCGLGEASLLALAGKCDRTSSTSFSSSQTGVFNDNDNEQLAAPSSSSSIRSSSSNGGSESSRQHHKRKGRCLTYFSSGTGLSGPFGFLWKMLWTGYFGLSLRSTCCLAAVVLATSYSYIYRSRLEGLRPGDDSMKSPRDVPRESVGTLDDHETTAVVMSPYQDRLDDSIRSRSSSPSTRQRYLAAQSALSSTGTTTSLPHPPVHNSHDEDAPILLDDAAERVDSPPSVSVDWAMAASHETAVLAIRDMDRSQRFRRVLQLWPYGVPLFTVYAAEYACQAGAWTAIGFPLQDAKARNTFYMGSNWLYQLGVFCSRSSGTLFEVSVPVLWLMPALQVLNLVFFSWAALHGDGTDATSVWWYNNTVFRILAFYAGLLGGAVYVHGYVRIVKDVDPLHTEFALAATSVAESIGILVADICGLVLQSCIYQAHDIDGALLSCPF